MVRANASESQHAVAQMVRGTQMPPEHSLDGVATAILLDFTINRQQCRLSPSSVPKHYAFAYLRMGVAHLRLSIERTVQIDLSLSVCPLDDQ